MTQPWEAVTSATLAAVMPLQAGYATPQRSPWAVRTMAALRHADPARPGVDPDLWEVTLGHLPTGLQGRGTSPATACEKAVHAAVVMYAIHQQSRPEPMHRRDAGLGQAVRALSTRRSGNPAELDPGTISRFQHLCRAQSWGIRLDNLRGLVTLMRSESVGQDYGRLAADLWRLQTRHADQVLLSWGRQMHHIPNPSTDTPTPSSAEGALS